jgi:hypothetical protein
MPSRGQKQASSSSRTRPMARRSRLRRHSLPAAALLLLCCGQVAEATPTSFSRGVSGRTARALTVDDSAHLKRVPTSSNEILEEGHATGTVPGTVRVYLNVGATVIVHFAIDTPAGSLNGVGTGKLKGRPSEPSFSGKMSVSHGTGRYKHAHGEGNFDGTINRATFSAFVQTSGTLSY